MLCTHCDADFYIPMGFFELFCLPNELFDVLIIPVEDNLYGGDVLDRSKKSVGFCVSRICGIVGGDE